jgi:hypothetical protein
VLSGYKISTKNIVFSPILIQEPGSSVSIVSDYRLDDRAIGVRSLTEAKRIFPLASVSTLVWGPPSILSNGYRGPFLGGKMQQGRDADHLPPSSAEVVIE